MYLYNQFEKTNDVYNDISHKMLKYVCQKDPSLL